MLLYSFAMVTLFAEISGSFSAEHLADSVSIAINLPRELLGVLP
jgi:hypothetical protein